MTLDKRLRDELQALERSAPTQAAQADPRERRLPWTRSWLVAATVLVGIVATSLALGPLRSLPAGHASPSANPPVVAQTRNGDLILTLSSTRSTWTTEDAIEVVAIITYVGERKRLDVGGGGGPIVFALRQLSGGDAILGGGQEEPCISYPIGPDSPLRFPFSKAGEVSDSGVFDMSFFEDPDLHLPPGRWEVIADLRYGIDGCDDLAMRVAIELEVFPLRRLPIPHRLDGYTHDFNEARGHRSRLRKLRQRRLRSGCGGCQLSAEHRQRRADPNRARPGARSRLARGGARMLRRWSVTLIDVIGQADGPLRATVRSEPWPDPPCR